MRIFLTRSAQVACALSSCTSDAVLTNLGRNQALLLADRLRTDDFCGVIYSSPFLRAVETADIIAGVVGASVVPMPSFHKSFRDAQSLCTFRGKSAQQLKSSFAHISRDFSMPDRWWQGEVETSEDSRYRVALAMNDIIRCGSGDVLVVAHDEVIAAICLYLTGEVDDTQFFNCSYTVFDTETKRIQKNDTSHLTIDRMTYNSIAFLDNDQKITIPDSLAADEGFRVLHIGDTYSYSYDWYISLVRRVKPDVIIHTGDTADEMKVGRDAAIRDRYLDMAGAFLRTLLTYCKRVIWLPGNNDLPDVLPSLVPGIECVCDGSNLEIGGISFSLAHDKRNLLDGADIHLYGHSTRYDVWSSERNTQFAPCYYLNAYWHATLISLPSRRLYKFALPLER